MLSRVIDPLTRSVRIQTAELAGMKAGEKALDVCCGTGALALHYARLGVNAVGIDMDPRVIQIADDKRRKQGLDNGAFQTANALKLPFEDATFDYASISLSLHENERAQSDVMISEMRRVVKEGGALVFIDYKVPLPRILSSYTILVGEFVMGRENNRYFKDYIKQGGLDGLLQRHDLRAEKKRELGPLGIIVTTNLWG